MTSLEEWIELWKSPPEGECELCGENSAFIWAFDDHKALCQSCARERGTQKLEEEGWRYDWTYGYRGWSTDWITLCASCAMNPDERNPMTALRSPKAWVDGFVAHEPHVAKLVDTSGGIPLHKRCFQREPFRWAQRFSENS